MTMSTSTPRRSSSGSTVAQLPTSPTDSAFRSFLAARHRCSAVVQVFGDDVEVPGLHPPGEPHRVDVDDQADAVVQGDRERLRAAHAAAAAGDGERAGQGAAEALRGDGRERLVGALQDALGADVDPRPGGHLPVHDQPGRLQAAELRPVRPVADQVGVGDQHPRRPLVGPDHADRLAGLDEHGLVLAQLGQRAHDRVERLPGPGGPAGAAVDDQVVGSLGHLRVEVVHQHPQRGLGLPGPGGERGAARGADCSGTLHTYRFPLHRARLTAAGPPFTIIPNGGVCHPAGPASRVYRVGRRGREMTGWARDQ